MNPKTISLLVIGAIVAICFTIGLFILRDKDELPATFEIQIPEFVQQPDEITCGPTSALDAPQGVWKASHSQRRRSTH